MAILSFTAFPVYRSSRATMAILIMVAKGALKIYPVDTWRKGWKSSMAEMQTQFIF